MQLRNKVINVRDTFTGSGIPVTITVIAGAILAFFLLQPALGNSFNISLLKVSQETFPSIPLTIITWPLIGNDGLLGTLFGVMWAFWVCGSLERSWGSQVFGIFLVGTNAITVLACWLLGHLLGSTFMLSGLTLGLTASTVAWCYINKREHVTIYFFFKIPAPWLGALSVAFSVYNIGDASGSRIMGLAGLVSPAVAYWYASGARFSLAKILNTRQRRTNVMDENPSHKSSNPLSAWLQRRKQKLRDEKVQKIFKDSGFDDDNRE